MAVVEFYSDHTIYVCKTLARNL